MCGTSCSSPSCRSWSTPCWAQEQCSSTTRWARGLGEGLLSSVPGVGECGCQAAVGVALARWFESGRAALGCVKRSAGRAVLLRALGRLQYIIKPPLSPLSSFRWHRDSDWCRTAEVGPGLGACGWCRHS